MLAVIRISGMVKVNKNIAETLERLRLRRKYSCVILDEKKVEIKGMIDKVRDFVAYGEIDEATLKKLVKGRGKKVGDKELEDKEVEEVVKGILEGKKIEDINEKVKSFFRLHPPRKGIDSKHHFPKGVLGNNGDKINDLIERML